jgi:hypothetical protein
MTRCKPGLKLSAGVSGLWGSLSAGQGTTSLPDVEHVRIALYAIPKQHEAGHGEARTEPCKPRCFVGEVLPSFYLDLRA